MADKYRLELHPKQLQVLQTPANEVLYGGAAGGGKSHLMRAALIYYCVTISGLQTALFRRLLPDLLQNHMQGPHSFPVLLAPLLARNMCRIIRNQIRFWNGSVISLLQCQYRDSVYKYQGSEFHVLCIDEATHWEEEMYRFLRGRCRVTGINVPAGLNFPRILLSANPGNIGHHWVKKGFVDHGYAPWETPLKEGSMLRQFIPATSKDNPSLLRDDPTYMIRLEGLGDPILVRAMKDGDWRIVVGSMFGETWRDERHIVRPMPIPLGWDIWRGGDDGLAKPASVHWLTQNPDRGTYYVLAELYREGMRPELFSEEIHRIDNSIVIQTPRDQQYNKEPLSGLMDPQAFTDMGGTEKISRGEQMNKMGCRWKPVEKPPGSRVARVQNMHRLLDVNLKDPEKKPGIIFFDVCENAIRTIPTLPRAKNNIEDVDTNAEDHAFDSVTYGLQYKVGGFRRVKIGGI